MKSEQDGDHPSSHYLIVEDPQKPTTWHLRVHNMQGDADMHLMGAAWAALHEGFRGNKYAGPGKAEALAKLKKMYSMMGKTPPGESNKAVFYRSGDDIWFFGVYSNNFEDKQSDIISEEAHEEFVDWLRTTGVKPPITIFHQPHYPEAIHAVNYMGLVYGKYTPDEYSANLDALYKPFAIAKTEKVMYLNGFTFVIGKVYEHKRTLVERLMEQSKTWGMSHGFIPVKTNGNIIEKYRSFEFTLAPNQFVVNQTTPIGFISKENLEKMDEKMKSLSDEERKLVEDLLDGKAEDLEEATNKAKEILSGVLASKAEEVDEDVVEDENTEDKKIIEVKATFDTAVLEQLTVTFKAIEGIIGELKTEVSTLAQKVNQLETKLTEVKKTEDEKVAEQLWFPNWKKAFEDLSVEKQEENTDVVKELKDKLPDQIVQDKVEAQDDVMQGLLWNLLPQS